MNSTLALALWSLAIFQAKHMFCDFALQTPYQRRNKGRYGHPGGLLHAGLHSVGSFPAVLLLTNSPSLLAAAFAGEFVIHYHIDWLKERIGRREHLTYDDTYYWIVFGVDQMLHQLTYVAIVALLASRIVL